MRNESTKKQLQAAWAVLVMLTLWVTVHTVKLNTIVPDFNSVNKTLNIILERVNDVEGFINEVKSQEEMKEVEELKEVLDNAIEDFGCKFNKMRKLYGPDAVFAWNDELYTTSYAEEVVNR